MGSDAKQLAIIGGGAAGLAAAIAAGERARKLGAALDVTVYERDDRVGRSILATGNGRCNFSNEHPYIADYRNGDFVEGAVRGLLAAHAAHATDRDIKMLDDNGHLVNLFFYQHGLMWRAEGDGRQYPRTNKASTVVDILRASAARVGVREACEHEVVAVQPPRGDGGRFSLQLKDKRLMRADAAIVACGGKAAASLRACGLVCHPLRPVLGPLACEETAVTRELDNIRVRCGVSLVRGEGVPPEAVATESGELLFRKYGVSGICVFNLSRFAEPGDKLVLNFLDGDDATQVERYLFSRRKLLARRFGEGLTCADMLRGLLLPRVAEAVLKQVGLRPSGPFAKAQVPALVRALTAFTLTVSGIGDESICQVRRGGFDVAAFDPRTMGARDVPGLFAAGEALDVDGPCGGYNLHWAWTSGLLAGMSAADTLCG